MIKDPRQLAIIFSGALLFLLANLGSAQAGPCDNAAKKYLAEKQFRAMAHSKKKSHCYWNYGAASRRQAEKGALKNCGKKTNDCRIIILQAERNELNKSIQSHLKTLKFYSGALDGIAGSGTRSAIQTYQKSRDRSVDGKATFELKKKLAQDVKFQAALHKLSNTSVCTRGTTKQSGKPRTFETRVFYQKYSDEILRRGLSLDQCTILLGDDEQVIASTKPTQKEVDDYKEAALSRRLAAMSPKLLCSNGTVKRRGQIRVFEERVFYRKFVDEISKRGLTIAQCATLLGDKEQNFASADLTQKAVQKHKEEARNKRLAAMSPKLLCSNGTVKRRGQIRVFEERAFYRKFVDEISRRGLSTIQCEKLLGDDRQVIATMKPRQKEIQKRKGEARNKRLAKMTEKVACIHGTTKLPDQSRLLESRASHQIYKNELARRGLSVEQCATLLGDKDQRTVAKLEKPKPVIAPINAALAAYNSGKFGVALTRFVPLAQKNNAIAQLHLGHIFSLGQGVPRNIEQAKVWYAKARDAGNPVASVLLFALNQSTTVTKSPSKKVVVDNPTVSKNLQRRLALVVGNGDYKHSTPLPNPLNDAKAMVGLLEAMGFEVISGFDLDRDSMQRTIRKFARKATEVDVSLFFYAGHGMQVGNRNFLVPVDAKLQEATAVDFELLDVQANVVKYMGGGAGKTGIVLLDACRDNPLARSFARTFRRTRSGTVGNGLAPMADQGGLLFGFATAPGDVAADGEGKNSPFTTALLKHLANPKLELQQVMTRVKREVVQNTGNKQRPWHNSDLTLDIYLAAR